MTAFGGTVRSVLDTPQALHILVDLLHHDPLLARHRCDLFRKPVGLLESGVEFAFQFAAHRHDIRDEPVCECEEGLRLSFNHLIFDVYFDIYQIRTFICWKKLRRAAADQTVHGLRL